MLNANRQGGLSLVELMVGLTVGLIVIAGATAIYVTNVRGQTNALRAAKLNQELRATINLMVADIRRAGYWRGSITGAGTTAALPHPYSGTQTSLSVLTNGTCIMYAYDADADGVNGVEAGEVFAYRLNGNAVEMIDPGNALAVTSDCSGTGWPALTSSTTVVIDALTFSTTGSQCFDATKDLSWKLTAAGATANPCSAAAADVTMNAGAYVAPATGDIVSEVRQVTISIRGHHQNDSSVASTITETVHIPNDRLYVVP
ncbi:MAG TPA: prepilin-type N-terminal cleavage/methylation domain-containing protein [Aromatoleum sp.]|uniref:prepilin-type N-terminal cleavage/methylation domain-containing protein n=1 Tax=Aromatoleum sp. TaxID=2307007 RepID=UPI002B475A33|nr:prepilin-type N-terminal cleavage/methylation domain-containing protein [Aromatoleum sp.]HJV25674.1 prepilin-type N-terminal cleavage/methylation domain-containing protein [Aromatoleum sp.]